MRVTIAIDPNDPHADWVRDDAESWLSDPLDAMDFWMRPVAAEHRGTRH
jgi:hypothetical protein